MRKPILLFGLIFLVALVACHQPSSYRSDLTSIEQILDENPDSALVLLDKIDYPYLSHQSEKALFGLLMTMARDKNHLSIPDDSLISNAYEFFSSIDDKERKLKSIYYLGRTYYLKGEYTKSMICFLEAKDMADEQKMFYWAGLSSRGISDIYNITYNSLEEVYYAEKELDYMRNSGKQPYEDYAIADLATAYYNNREYAKAMNYLRQALDSASNHRDGYLTHEANRLMARCLLREEKFDSALNLISKISASEFSTAEDSVIMCEILIGKGKYEEATRIVSGLSTIDPYWQHLIEYQALQQKEQYKEALNEKERLADMTDSVFNSMLRQNIQGSVVNYYSLKKRLAESELTSAKKNILILVLGCIIFFIIVFTIASLIIQHQRREIDKKFLLAEELRELICKSENQLVKRNEAIRKLISTKFDLIKNFSSIGGQQKFEEIYNHKIVSCVNRVIEELSGNTTKLKEMEQEINDSLENLFSDFRKDLPNLKDEDYRLYLYCIYGFKSNAIALFLKEDNINAVYNRKRHLKDKIKSLSAEKRERYLTFLS